MHHAVVTLTQCVQIRIRSTLSIIAPVNLWISRKVQS